MKNMSYKIGNISRERNYKKEPITISGVEKYNTCHENFTRETQ